MKQAHLIGDSHTIMYADLNGICSYHFGACTAYSLLNESSITGSFQKIKKFLIDHDPKKDLIILGFGEIDCRILIYFKLTKYKIDLADMIDIVVYRYFSAISYIQDRGYDVAIHGIIPAVQQGNEYNLEYYAESLERAIINREFNARMKLKCNREFIKYFDTFELSYLLNNNGVIPSENLLPDLVHVNPKKVPIVKDFKNWLIKERLVK